MSKRLKRHSPEQIVKKLREADATQAAGQSDRKVCQTLEVSEPTYHRWRKRYGGKQSRSPTGEERGRPRTVA